MVALYENGELFFWSILEIEVGKYNLGFGFSIEFAKYF